MPFAAALLVLAAAPAASPPALTPKGPWLVRADEDLCRLERTYPTGADTVGLLFQPLLDLPTMEMFVVTPDRSERQYTGNFTARVEPGGETLTGTYFSVRSATAKKRVTRLTVNRSALDGLKDGDTLRVRAKPVDLVFTIVHPDKARDTLNRCVNDLKKSWGIDPAIAAQAVKPLEGDPGRYFNSESYPREALNEGVYGRVIALLNVGVDGTVQHCRIVSSAGASLNAGTCKAALNVRFKPPRDKDGQPLASTYLLPVRWILPGSPDS